MEWQPYLTTVNIAMNDRIRTLLRSGALEQAEKEYFRHTLDKDTSSEDVMALGGRILKAKALEQQGAERQRLALLSAEKYGTAHKRFHGTFSGINTAAMLLVGGKAEQARAVAAEVQQSLKTKSPAPGPDAYYHMATMAEAWLILGDQTRAERTFADAVPLDPHNYEARASTIRQFEMLLNAAGQNADWLTSFRPPKSLHFAGHLFGLTGGHNPLDVAEVYGLEKAIDDYLTNDMIGAAYGALAAGSDIIIAERLLANGLELNVVQPCPDDLFSTVSLAPFGAEWQARFEQVMAQAASIRIVSLDQTVCDDLTTAFASETAMGLAVLHADRFATTAEQLLIWDEKPTDQAAGTARDAWLWASAGRQQKVVRFPWERPQKTTLTHNIRDERSLKAMLFADVRGFGKLSEKQVPVFVSQVLAELKTRLENHGIIPQHLNTWGDGLFLVFNHVAEAAHAATELQSGFRAIDLEAAGLPENLALRIGGHYGPVHCLKDPFLGTPGYFGREVTTAARIEPVTAPGSVFVSEPFACALSLSHLEEFRCEPMAERVTPGNAPAISLFSLRKTRSVTSSG